VKREEERNVVKILVFRIIVLACVSYSMAMEIREIHSLIVNDPGTPEMVVSTQTSE